MPKCAQRGVTRAGEASSTSSSCASSCWRCRRTRRKRMRSPGSAPATKAALPSATMPSPSWVSAARRSLLRLSDHLGGPARPAQAAPPRHAGIRRSAAQCRRASSAFTRSTSSRVLFAARAAAHQLEAQIDEIGIEHIRLAVLADADNVPRTARPPRPGSRRSRACPGSPSSAATRQRGARRGPGNRTACPSDPCGANESGSGSCCSGRPCPTRPSPNSASACTPARAPGTAAPADQNQRRSRTPGPGSTSRCHRRSAA